MLNITVYTDPLCCWSWCASPQWAQLEQYLGESAEWNYQMGGLLPSWSHFTDDTNAVSRPAQMGPMWMHAAQLTNRPIDTRIWHTDPPATSYPACVAVKAAGLQSASLGRQYFQYAQEAVMLEGRNIARPGVLLEIAEKLFLARQDFDVKRFSTEYNSETAMEAFRHDLSQAQYYRVSRLPTMVIRRGTDPSMAISGFRRYEELLQLISNSVG